VRLSALSAQKADIPRCRTSLTVRSVNLGNTARTLAPAALPSATNALRASSAANLSSRVANTVVRAFTKACIAVSIAQSVRSESSVQSQIKTLAKIAKRVRSRLALKHQSVRNAQWAGKSPQKGLAAASTVSWGNTATNRAWATAPNARKAHSSRVRDKDHASNVHRASTVSKDKLDANVAQRESFNRRKANQPASSARRAIINPAWSRAPVLNARLVCTRRVPRSGLASHALMADTMCT
jgi:hypothetical protein